MPSSGCEKNWSTFTLVRTEVRNRLSYEKLHKLVYVHYNLKLAIEQFEADFQSFRQNVALFDEYNPIMDWLSNSMTESSPVLDEYDDNDDEWTAHGGFLISELDMNKKRSVCIQEETWFWQKGW